MDDDNAEPNADMWATADESREHVVGLYRRISAHSDAVIVDLPLDAVGHVPWWPPEHSEVTLHHILVHTIAEAHRHAGHADIVRELVDGSVGLLDEGAVCCAGGRPGLVGSPPRPGGAGRATGRAIRENGLTGTGSGPVASSGHALVERVPGRSRSSRLLCGRPEPARVATKLYVGAHDQRASGVARHRRDALAFTCDRHAVVLTQPRPLSAADLVELDRRGALPADHARTLTL